MCEEEASRHATLACSGPAQPAATGPHGSMCCRGAATCAAPCCVVPVLVVAQLARQELVLSGLSWCQCWCQCWCWCWRQCVRRPPLQRAACEPPAGVPFWPCSDVQDWCVAGDESEGGGQEQ